MITKRFLAALAAGVLLFAACGDDDDGGGTSSGGGESSAESNEFSEAIAASITEDGDSPFSDSEANCIAAEIVDALGGPSGLEAAGVTPEAIADSEDMSELGLDIDDDQAKKIGGSFDKCGINLQELLIAEIGDDLPDEAKGCIENALDNDTIADLFVGELTGEGGSDEPPPELFAALQECLGG